MNFIVTAKFFFDNSEVRSICWSLDEPVLREGESSIPITSTKAVKDSLRAMFTQMHSKESIFSVTSYSGELEGVSFKKIASWSLTVEEEGEYLKRADKPEEVVISKYPIPPAPSPAPLRPSSRGVRQR